MGLSFLIRNIFFKYLSFGIITLLFCTLLFTPLHASSTVEEDHEKAVLNAVVKQLAQNEGIELDTENKEKDTEESAQNSSSSEKTDTDTAVNSDEKTTETVTVDSDKEDSVAEVNETDAEESVDVSVTSVDVSVTSVDVSVPSVDDSSVNNDKQITDNTTSDPAKEEEIQTEDVATEDETTDKGEAVDSENKEVAESEKSEEGDDEKIVAASDNEKQEKVVKKTKKRTRNRLTVDEKLTADYVLNTRFNEKAITNTGLGWVYLGQFISNEWSKKTLDIPNKLPQVGRNYTVMQSLNLRSDLPAKQGSAQLIKSLKADDRVTILKVRRSGRQGHYWAQVKTNL